MEQLEFSLFPLPRIAESEEGHSQCPKYNSFN